MSQKYCSSCGKPIREHFYDDHKFDRHHHDHHSFDDHHDHYHHGSPHFHDDCICEKSICDDHFKVRLGGLTHGLNFRLRQLIGCKVKLNVDCDGCEKILAEICHVGSNFVEVKVLKHLDASDSEDQADDVAELEEELDALLEEMDELEEEIAELQEELEELEEEAEAEEDEEEVEEMLERIRKKRKQLHKRKKKKKFHKSKFAIFRLDAIKWYELDDDSDCDCH
ncbi:hypothetical protein [Salirhabdus sp. Marseille-P4669]|uniref:hypothetical protein n=1 Tax=Salirhabdus sp. Marseille-P4669 TaxID=2042310 RepID=UPI000C7BABC0|nr:hypothetical protein [Salirhabdus sp. Marseille-P4669]